MKTTIDVFVKEIIVMLNPRLMRAMMRPILMMTLSASCQVLQTRLQTDKTLLTIHRMSYWKIHQVKIHKLIVKFRNTPL